MVPYIKQMVSLEEQRGAIDSWGWDMEFSLSMILQILKHFLLDTHTHTFNVQLGALTEICMKTLSVSPGSDDEIQCTMYYVLHLR